MITLIDNASSNIPFPRLNSNEVRFDPDMVRICNIKEQSLIFFEDLDRMTDDDFSKVIYRYDLDPDNIGVIVDEVQVINNPHILHKAKQRVCPDKIYIRPIPIQKHIKVVEQFIKECSETDNWVCFDDYVENGLVTEDTDNIEYAAKKAGEEVKKGARRSLDKIKDDAKSYTKKAAIGVGALAALHVGLSSYTKGYAQRDYNTSPENRSKLIARLRALRGKLGKYETAYERARRYQYENSSRLGKIVLKIKWAIQRILEKLGIKKSPYIDRR